MISCPMRERVLGRLAAEKAASQGDRPFIYFGDLTISYRELDTLSNRLANGLAALGVKKGTHVALLIENKPEIVLMYFALGKLGAVSVPVNTAVAGMTLHGPPESRYECDEHHIRFASVEYRDLWNAAPRTD